MTRVGWSGWLLLAGCGGAAAPPPPELQWVRDGVLGAELTGPALADGRHVQALDWSPGALLTVAGQQVRAPLEAECVAIGSLALGDPGAGFRAGGKPESVVAFSPGGERVAVGTETGQLWVLDGWTGAVLASVSFPEAAVQRLAWSADGTRLWVGEQSPDGWVRALDGRDLKELGRVRLADYVGESPPPARDDLYGRYTLPGAYGLVALADGGLVIAATHGWDGPAGRQAQARVLRLLPDLSVAAVWPAQAAANGVIHALAVDQSQVAISVARGHGDAEPLLPDGLIVLAPNELTEVSRYPLAPLAPYYDRVYAFDSVRIAGGSVYAGLADGRALRAGAWTAEVGTPTLVAEIPVAATLGGVAVVGPRLVVWASSSSVPYGSADPALRPPAPHEAADSLSALGLEDGGLAWRWRDEVALEGLVAGPGAGELTVGTRAPDGSDRRDADGVIVLAVGEAGPTVRARCALPGPIGSPPAVSEDGRLAVVSLPRRAQEQVDGRWVLTLYR